MTCSFIPADPHITTLILSWYADADNLQDPMKTVATFVLNNAIDIAPAYEGRAFLEVDVANQVSTLRLTKLTVKDSRTFQCSVIIPGDDEGTTAAATSLFVLVAPSVPLCTIQGRAEYWQNITLTCKSEEGSPKPVYQWKSYSVESIPRRLTPPTTDKNGVLSLFNISRETSGFFICTSSNRIGSASCNFTLAVMPGSMNIGSTAGIIVGVLAGFLVLGVLVFCCCRKKKKDKYVEGSPTEMEFYDGDAPEAGKGYRDQNHEEKLNHREDNDFPQKSINVEAATAERGYESGVERRVDKGSDSGSNEDSQFNHYHLDDKRDHYGGSRDHIRERNNYRGSRDGLEDQRNQYGGSRDRLDDQRDRYGGSRDRLDDQRDRYGGSRDRLDDQRDRYRGSRDRLDDQRDRHRGSRDQLDDQRDRYGGSRDRLDVRRDQYSGSRDRLDDQRDRYRGSRDGLDNQRDGYGGSHDRLDDGRDYYGGSRDRLDDQPYR
ncbi:uncharacterized protein ACBR49_006523 [Aulostomus maculatus]